MKYTTKAFIFSSILALQFGMIPGESSASVKERLKFFENLGKKPDTPRSESPVSKGSKEGGAVARLKEKFESGPVSPRKKPIVADIVKPHQSVKDIAKKFQGPTKKPLETEDEKRINAHIQEIKETATDKHKDIRAFVHDHKIKEQLVNESQSITEHEIKVKEDHLKLYKEIDANKNPTPEEAERIEKKSKRLDEEVKKVAQRQENLDQKIDHIIYTEEKQRETKGLMDELESTEKMVKKTMEKIKKISEENGFRFTKTSETRLRKEYADIKSELEESLKKFHDLQEKHKDLIATKVGDPAPHNWKDVVEEENKLSAKLKELYNKEHVFLAKLEGMHQARVARGEGAIQKTLR